MKKLLLPILTGFIMLGCQTQTATTTSSQELKSNENIVIKIIQINDVYEIDAVNNGKSGGLARVAGIRDSIANQNPNTWFFLAGDFVNPSLLGTIKVDGERLQGKQMIEVLNLSGLDLVTFGNHEFDIKEPDLQKRIDESEFTWMSANVRQVTKDGNKPFYKQTLTGREYFSDFMIYTAENSNGDRVNFGVFGVTIPSNPKDFVHYDDIYDESVRAYNEASQNSDFVLGLTHVSIEQDKEIARRIPDIQLIMGGHEHNNMLVNVGKSVIAKADANVVSLYVHTLTYNPATKNLIIDSELVPVTDKYSSKPEVQAAVDKWNKILDQNLKTVLDDPYEVVYHAAVPLDGTDTASRSEQTNLGTILGKSMSLAYDNQPDGAFSNGGGIRIDDRLSGDITGKDVFRILPFGGSVLLVDMTGKLLRKVLDFGLNASGTGAYLQRYNIDQNPRGEWQVKGQPLDDSKTYSVAVNDFLMLGLDIPFLTKDNPGVLKIYTPKEDEIAGDLRKCIISYFKSGGN